MINKFLKKYLLWIGLNETGAMLIISFLIMVLLTIVGGAALTNSIIETKISANFQKSSRAFYIADGGIEAAKGSLLIADINDILDGADDNAGTPGDNGYLPTGIIGGGNYSVRVTDDEGWVDTDTKVILTSTGTTPTGENHKIETIVLVDPFPFPGALSFVGTAGAPDKFRIDLHGATSDNISTGVNWGAVITGKDTPDGSPSVDTGSCQDKAGVATPKASFDHDGIHMALVDGAVWGIDEVATELCDPAPSGECPDPIISGSSASLVSAGGPTAAETMTMISNFEGMAAGSHILTAAKTSDVGGTPPDDWGTVGSPKITVIQNDYTLDMNITGYGVLIVKGALIFDSGLSDNLEWHGLIFVIDDGKLEMNGDQTDDMKVWGGIVIHDSDGNGVEEFRLSKGKMHVYYSCEAIRSYVPGAGLQTIAWRELA